MEIFYRSTGEQVEQRLAKLTGKWVLSIGPVYHEDGHDASAPLFDFAEARKAIAIPELDGNAVVDGAVILCDSEAQCQDLFERIVGDGGPTAKNSFDGPYRAYACTVEPDGCYCLELGWSVSVDGTRFGSPCCMAYCYGKGLGLNNSTRR